MLSAKHFYSLVLPFILALGILVPSLTFAGQLLCKSTEGSSKVEMYFEGASTNQLQKIVIAGREIRLHVSQKLAESGWPLGSYFAKDVVESVLLDLERSGDRSGLYQGRVTAVLEDQGRQHEENYEVSCEQI